MGVSEPVFHGFSSWLGQALLLCWQNIFSFPIGQSNRKSESRPHWENITRLCNTTKCGPFSGLFCFLDLLNWPHCFTIVILHLEIIWHNVYNRFLLLNIRLLNLPNCEEWIYLLYKLSHLWYFLITEQNKLRQSFSIFFSNESKFSVSISFTSFVKLIPKCFEFC